MRMPMSSADSVVVMAVNHAEKRELPSDSNRKATHMDKDRIKGSAEQAKGSLKEKAGKLTGDTKLESEGKADKAAGKVRNTVGGVKDTLRGDD
jgi:uncharacterized protein YjbJ (UPF0337 family)